MLQMSTSIMTKRMMGTPQRIECNEANEAIIGKIGKTDYRVYYVIFLIGLSNAPIVSWYLRDIAQVRSTVNLDIAQP